MTFYKNLEYSYDSRLFTGSSGTISTCSLDNKNYVCKQLDDTYETVFDNIVSEVACLSLLTTLNIQNVPILNSFNYSMYDDAFSVKLYIDKYDMTLKKYARDISFLNTRINQFNFVYENLMKAISYLHGLGIIHCDVKNCNILVNVSNCKITKLCLADYNISSSSPRNESYTVGFRAPFLSTETSNNKRSADGERPSIRSDLFACGMVFVTYFNDCTILSSKEVNSEISNMRTLLANNPEIIEIVDRLLKYDTTMPHYNPIKSTVNLRQNPIRENVKLKIEEIGKNLECSEDDIKMAIDIASRYIEKKQYTETYIITDELCYGSIMLAVVWGSPFYHSIIENIDNQVESTDELTKYVLNMIEVLDGLIYNPGFNF